MRSGIQTFVAFTSLALLATSPMAAAAAPSGKPLKVYILAGQSNMQGQAGWWVAPALADHPSTGHLHERFVDADGGFRQEENVYVAALSGEDQPVEKNGALTVGFGGALTGSLDQTGRHGARWGPEWGFGVTLDDHFENPILLIKTSWGGKNLSTDFRPPSAGPYVYRETVLEGLVERRNMSRDEIIAEKNDATGRFYRDMMDHVRKVLENPGDYHPAYDPEAGYEISGFVWLQGWNDMVDSHTYDPGLVAGRYAAYSDVLAHLIRDVRKDLETPDMPFVIGVIGVGNEEFAGAMAAPADMEEFKDNVIAVPMKEYMDRKLMELYDRRTSWQDRNDPENKFAQLRERLAPLLMEREETELIEDRREQNRRRSEIDQQMRAVIYTPEELEYMERNHSSQGFHYLGSPKFFGLVGEAFAHALIEFEKARQGQ